MNLSGWILKKTGWTFKVNLEMPDKCIIVIAPHTSNWDFILGELGIHSVGMKAGFLMKDTWFFFPVAIGVTPEGTRSANPNWHKGAIFMARDAKVPLVLAYFDYNNRVVCIDRELELSDDADADLIRIKRYFKQNGCGKFPEKFVTGLE